MQTDQSSSMRVLNPKTFPLGAQAQPFVNDLWTYSFDGQSTTFMLLKRLAGDIGAVVSQHTREELQTFRLQREQLELTLIRRAGKLIVDCAEADAVNKNIEETWAKEFGIPNEVSIRVPGSAAPVPMQIKRRDLGAGGLAAIAVDWLGCAEPFVIGRFHPQCNRFVWRDSLDRPLICDRCGFKLLRRGGTFKFKKSGGVNPPSLAYTRAVLNEKILTDQFTEKAESEGRFERLFGPPLEPWLTLDTWSPLTVPVHNPSDTSHVSYPPQLPSVSSVDAAPKWLPSITLPQSPLPVTSFANVMTQIPSVEGPSSSQSTSPWPLLDAIPPRARVPSRGAASSPLPPFLRWNPDPVPEAECQMEAFLGMDIGDVEGPPGKRLRCNDDGTPPAKRPRFDASVVEEFFIDLLSLTRGPVLEQDKKACTYALCGALCAEKSKGHKFSEESPVWGIPQQYVSGEISEKDGGIAVGLMWSSDAAVSWHMAHGRPRAWFEASDRLCFWVKNCLDCVVLGSVALITDGAVETSKNVGQARMVKALRLKGGEFKNNDLCFMLKPGQSLNLGETKVGVFRGVHLCTRGKGPARTQGTALLYYRRVELNKDGRLDLSGPNTWYTAGWPFAMLGVLDVC